MTVIGVTDETKGKVQPYIEQNSIEYVIALGGGGGYKTTGIPHAWLVSADRTVVWKGHPSELKEPLIEEHLAKVRLQPVFKLPKDLASAEKSLNTGKYAAGVKALEKYLEKPKDEASASEARKAVEEVKTYGDDKYKQAESYAAEGYYGEAMEILAALERDFKGLEIGEKSKEKRAEWKKDTAVKAELEAGAYLDQAADLCRQKKYRAAYPLLQKVLQSKKYETTKARARAEAKLKEIEGFL